MDEVGDRDEGVRASSRTGPADAGSSRATPTVAAVQLDARTLQTLISGVTAQLRGEGGARTLLPQMKGPGNDVSPQGTSEDREGGVGVPSGRAPVEGRTGRAGDAAARVEPNPPRDMYKKK